MIDTLSAAAMGEANRNNPSMVFDWDKAAQLIRDAKPNRASAGLRSDWEYTGGDIYKDGETVIDDCTYLSSTWAVPELDMDGDVVACYIMKADSPGWNADTRWPDSAVKILGGE